MVYYKMEFTPIDDIIERYLSGEINPTFLYDDILEYDLEERSKLDLKPYPDWIEMESFTPEHHNMWEAIKPQLIQHCKDNDFDAVFLSKISSIMSSLLDWEKSVIVWYSSQKPQHEFQKLVEMRRKRGAWKDK